MLVLALLVLACRTPHTSGSPETDGPIGCERVPWYPDGDGDGWGVGQIGTTACLAPEGYAEATGDCDDADPAVHPSSGELCDELDQDCDDRVDEDLSTELVFLDEDGDGFGDERVAACALHAGLSQEGGDCDDLRADVSPGSPEVCDGVDNDCDALVDVSDPSLEGLQVWFPDEDSDGYGGLNRSVYACFAPPGYADNDQDCEDNDSSVNPAAVEVCYDGRDQDCDGRTDDYTDACFVSTTGASCTPAPADLSLCTAGVAVVGDGAVYATVQAALDAAPPEVVLTLCPGRYAGPFVARGALTMVGFGAGGSVLDGAGGRVLSAPAGAAVSLADLSLEGGGGADGGAIGGEDLQICASGVGFGFNAVSGNGGALSLTGAGELTLVECVLSANGAVGLGGAVAIDGAYTVESVGSLWVSNDAGHDGGALWTSASEAYFASSWLLRNSAGAGGGVSTEGALSSTSTDWGSGADDNTPEDLRTAAGTYRFGAEDFTCGADGACE